LITLVSRCLRTLISAQERSANIEAQLAEATSQLQHLRLRQRQLEARNRLLELAAANKQSASPASAPQRGLQAGKSQQRHYTSSAMHSIQCTAMAARQTLALVL